MIIEKSDENLIKKYFSEYLDQVVLTLKNNKCDELLLNSLKVYGKVMRVSGLRIEATGLNVPAGTICQINIGSEKAFAEVTAFSHGITLLMAMTSLDGVKQGAEVIPIKAVDQVAVSDQLVGRVFDAMGVPLDGKGNLVTNNYWPLYAKVFNPLKKEKIQQTMDVGIKAINGLLTAGKGQRVGIFSGSGVGKSVLLGMMTRFSKADVIVVGLIGERGREVKEFIEDSMGPAGISRSVVIASAADTSPIMRARGALMATAIAEYFRDRGKNVLLIIDSITRYAHALREIASSTGEVPAMRGYGASVFSSLSKLVERAGMGDTGKGSITAYYTVLVEGDDHEEPISDHMRSVLDGHIFLSRELAGNGHYPAIDILRSASRVMHAVVSPTHWKIAHAFRKLYSEYERHKEMILMGMYQAGTNSLIDRSIALKKKMDEFLQQSMNENFNIDESINLLKEVIDSKD